MKTDYATLRRIKTLAGLVSGKKVLDIGCRGGDLKKFLFSGIEHYGLDKGEIAPDPKEDKKIKILRDGILDAKAGKAFGNLKFDSIILAETLEHLLNPLGALKIMYSLLGKGGEFIGSVPNAVGWRYFFFLDLIGDGMADFEKPRWDGTEHFYTFNKYVLKTLLMYAGFKVKMIKEWGVWIPHTKIFLPVNFRGSHIIFVAEKK